MVIIDSEIESWMNVAQAAGCPVDWVQSRLDRADKKN